MAGQEDAKEDQCLAGFVLGQSCDITPGRGQFQPLLHSWVLLEKGARAVTELCSKVKDVWQTSALPSCRWKTCCCEASIDVDLLSQCRTVSEAFCTTFQYKIPDAVWI